MALTTTAGIRLDIEAGHRPFQIEARLRTGVGFDPPYGLDLAGLLAARMRLGQRAAWADAGEHQIQSDSTEESPADMNLPLSRCLTGPDWHWLGSCVVSLDAEADPEPRTFYRVLDSAWAQHAAERPLPYFHPSGGAYRDVMMPSPVVLCSRLMWRGIGDPEAVLRLLRPMRFIGRRRAAGEGKILEWSLGSAPHDVDAEQGARWAHLDGEAIIRPCPKECVERLGLPQEVWREGYYAIRPPSWSPDRLVRLAMSATEEEW